VNVAQNANSVSYLVSDWTGDDALIVGSTFQGDEEGDGIAKERKNI